MNSPRNRQREGAALVLVLGALAVITLLIVALMSSAELQRRASRNFRRQTAAEHYLRAAIPLAMSAVDQSMIDAEALIPMKAWNSPLLLAPPLAGDDAHANILNGSMTNALPLIYRDAVATNSEAFASRWIYIERKLPNGETVSTNGRVAFVVADISGFVDYNTAPSGLITNLIDADVLLEPPGDRETFYTLEDLRSGDADWVAATSNLVCDSYDAAPDLILTNSPGYRSTALAKKFPINSFSNLNTTGIATIEDYQNDLFVEDYLSPLYHVLISSGYGEATARRIAWNLINYIDGDALPQNDSDQPWLSAGLVESVPVINEIALTALTTERDTATNQYEWLTELWYPFNTNSLNTTQLRLQLNALLTIRSADTAQLLQTREQSLLLPLDAFPFEEGLTPGDFQLLKSGDAEAITFPLQVPGPSGTQTLYLPIGPSTYGYYDGTTWQSNSVVCSAMLKASLTNTFYAATVDATGPYSLVFTNEYGYATDAPFQNGTLAHWMGPIHKAEQTRLDTNTVFIAANMISGPLFIRNDKLERVGELGLISQDGFQTVDCLTEAGAGLFDLASCRNYTNQPIRGLVGIGASDTVLKALLLTNNNTTNTIPHRLAEDDARQLGTLIARAIETAPAPTTWRRLLPEIPLQAGWTDWLSNEYADTREAPIRALIEKISHRQNVLGLYLLAQATTEDGARSVAERRATAIVIRDAYTGKWVLKNLQWITGP